MSLPTSVRPVPDFVPFPVDAVPQSPRPDIRPTSEPLFVLDDRAAEYRREKERELSRPWGCLLSDDADPSAVTEAIERLAHHAEPSGGARRELSEGSGGGADASESTSDQPSTAFDSPLSAGRALALSIQEDLVLMRGATFEAGWVAFPSRWDPASVVGRTFAEMHRPVPGAARLESAETQLVSALVSKGPFERFVWTLTTDPSLSQHPNLAKEDDDGPIHFRVERQVTFPMPGLGRFWFLIRVFVEPLAGIVSTPERAERLRNALERMPSEMRAYKRLERLVPRAIGELRVLGGVAVPVSAD